MCDTLYKIRCLFWKLIPALYIIDLVLTIWICTAVFNLDVFACCVDNTTDDGYGEMCSYEDIGGADNVGVYSNDGEDAEYCRNQKNDFDCGSDEFTQCAIDQGADLNELCSESVLEDVAHFNWTWLTSILIVKSVGLLFLLILECKSWFCKKKSDKDAGKTAEEVSAEEEGKATSNCTKCKAMTGKCLCSVIILVLKLFFLVFGTIASMLVLYLLRYTDRVSQGSCRSLSGSLKSDCWAVEENCTDDGNESYYNVVFADGSIDGPIVLNIVVTLLTFVLFIVRFSVVIHFYRHPVQTVRDV